MNEQEIYAFIQQTENDLSTAKAFLAVWKRRNGLQNPAAVAPAEQVQQPLIPSVDASLNQGAYGSASRIVRDAISKCPTEYSIYDIEKIAIESGATISRMSISQALSRMSKDGEIKVKVAGVGRKPSIYSKDL